MIIKRVEAQNLKGRTFEYDLGAAVAIVGDNFTGKTSIIDAIRLPLIGFIPELGKTNAATWQLSSGERMTVLLTFDNGSTRALDSHLEKDAVKISVGGEYVTDTPLLNAAAYFAMSERDRYDYVFRIAKLPEAYTAKSVIAELERISFEEAHSEAIEHAKAEIVAVVRKYLCDAPFQECLNATISALKSMFTAWNARAKDTQGAVRVMAELKNRQATMAGNSRQLKEVEALARAEADRAGVKLDMLHVRTKEARQYQERTERLKRLHDAVVSDAEVKKLEKNIEESIPLLKPRIAEPNDIGELADEQERLAVLVRDDRLALVRNEQQLKELEKATECPHCGSNGKNWKANLEGVLNGNITELKNRLAANEAVLATVKQEFNEVDRAWEHFKADLAHNKEINGRIIMWRQQLDDLNKKKRRWQEEIDAAAEQDVEEATAPVPGEIAAAEIACSTAKKSLTEVSDKLRQVELLEHELKRAAQAEQEHESAKATVAVIKAVLKVLEAKKAELVDLVFDGLLAVANQVAGAILPTALSFHEGEVGRWDGHRWISHKTFSGAEQALTFVAIAAALSQGSPLKLLIFDEMGRLSPRVQLMLIGVLQAALANRLIDQFIIAGATMPPAFPSNFTVISL